MIDDLYRLEKFLALCKEAHVLPDVDSEDKAAVEE
jgi:hypothetical protein